MNEINVSEVPIQSRHRDTPVELYLNMFASLNEQNIIANTFAFGDIPRRKSMHRLIKKEGSGIRLESGSGGMCVHLGDGYFVTAEHVMMEHSPKSALYGEGKKRIPSVLYDVKGDKRAIHPDLIYTNPKMRLGFADDFAIFRVDPFQFPWIKKLPQYSFIDNHKTGEGRSACIGVPEQIEPAGHHSYGDIQLAFDNVGRQMTVRFIDHDTPVLIKQEKDERFLLSKKSKHRAWEFDVPLTTGYSGGPFIHEGALAGISVGVDGEREKTFAVDIKLVLKKIRELM